MTVTPLPAKGTGASGRVAAELDRNKVQRALSTLDQLEAALDARIAERDTAKAVLAELTLKAGKAADLIVVEKRAVEAASTGLAERADDPAAMREFQDASFRLAAATAADDAFKNVVLPKARANLAEKKEAVDKAYDVVLREKRRLAVGPRIAAARKLVAAGQALLAAIHEWDDAGKAIVAIRGGSGPSLEIWRSIFAMPAELEEIFWMMRIPLLAGDRFSSARFVDTEIAAWGVGDPTQDASA